MKKFKKAKDIKVGVIGYGGAFNMGKIHLDEMHRAGMTPIAVAELDPSRLNVATADFQGIETYGSVADMLKKSDVNVVTIITPHNTHAKLAMQCLRSGRHVVCEKPLAITTGECDAMIAEAKKRKLVLTTYHNRHWDGCIMDAVKAVKKGAIGEVFRIDAHMCGYGKPGDWWRSSKSISGGILYDWGVHLLEYSLQILDSGIKEVSAFAHEGFWAPKTAWKDDCNEDEAFAVVRFRNKTWMTLHISDMDFSSYPGEIAIMGTKGQYSFTQQTHTLTRCVKGKTIVTEGENRPCEGWRFYKNVANHMTKGTKLVITPEWARRPIHILDLARKSAKQGKALQAKYR